LNTAFYHQTVTTQQIENYICKQTGYDLTRFFNQYLRDIRIPTLEYSIKNRELKYRWINVVHNFEMPIQVTINSEKQWIQPKAEWQTKKISSKNAVIIVDPNFYVESK